MVNARISNRIRRFRFERDEMTQEELGRRAGCTRQTVIALEQGKFVPSIELAFRIAHALDAPLEDVFQYHSADGRSGAADADDKQVDSARQRGENGSRPS